MRQVRRSEWEAGAEPVHMQDDAMQGDENSVAVLEALLFVSPEPLPLARLTTVIWGQSRKPKWFRRWDFLRTIWIRMDEASSWSSLQAAIGW